MVYPLCLIVTCCDIAIDMNFPYFPPIGRFGGKLFSLGFRIYFLRRNSPFRGEVVVIFTGFCPNLHYFGGFVQVHTYPYVILGCP